MMKLKIAGCILGFVVISFVPDMANIGNVVNEAKSEARTESTYERKERKTKSDKASRSDRSGSKNTKDAIRMLLRDCMEDMNEDTCAAAAPAAEAVPAAVLVEDKAYEAEPAAEVYYTIDESDGDDDTITVVKVNRSVPLKAKPEYNARKITSISRGETYIYITTHVCDDHKWYEVDYWGTTAYLNGDACEIKELCEDEYAQEYEYMCDLYGVR